MTTASLFTAELRWGFEVPTHNPTSSSFTNMKACKPLQQRTRAGCSLRVLDGHDDRLLEKPLGLLQPRHVLPPDVRMPDHNVGSYQGRHLLDLHTAEVGGRGKGVRVGVVVNVLEKRGLQSS